MFIDSTESAISYQIRSVDFQKGLIFPPTYNLLTEINIAHFKSRKGLRVVKWLIAMRLVFKFAFLTRLRLQTNVIIKNSTEKTFMCLNNFWQ